MHLVSLRKNVNPLNLIFDNIVRVLGISTTRTTWDNTCRVEAHITDHARGFAPDMEKYKVV